MSGTVAYIPDDELLRRAVRGVVSKRRSGPAWAAISQTFALGSTYSAQLCRRFGIDPETGRATKEPTT